MTKRGQGALEYLLRIGGAVLVATVVMILLLATAPTGGGLLNDALDGYDDIGLNDLPTAPPAEPFPGTYELANDTVSFSFEEVVGDSLQLQSLASISGGVKTTWYDMSGSPLWQIRMREASTYDSPPATKLINGTTVDCPNPILYSTWKKNAIHYVEFTWPGCRHPTFPASEFIDVSMRVALSDGTDRGHWQLFVKNHTSTHGIFSALLQFRVHQSGMDDYLLIPSNSGMVIKNPAQNFPNALQQSVINGTQLQAYYTPDTGKGIYFSSLDPQATRSKYKVWIKGTNSLDFIMGEYGENAITNVDFSFPYAYDIGLFDGDWYDAAQLYRNWAVTTPIVSAGKLRDRTDIPVWWKELGMLLIQNSPPAQLDSSAASFFKGVKDYYLPPSQYPTGNDLGLFQWTWYESYYDASTDSWGVGGEDGYGTYTPLNGTYTDFQNGGTLTANIPAYVAALKAQDASIRPSFYTLSMAFSQKNPTYATGNWPAYACKDASGNDHGDGMVVPMDPSKGVWQDHYASVIEDVLIPLGADGVYLDNPYIVYQGCFDASQGHLGQGGTYLFGGYATLMKKIRTVDPNFVLFFEQGIEAYLSSADTFSNLGHTDEPLAGVPNPNENVERVPLIETIYHDYIVFNSANAYPDISGGAYEDHTATGNPSVLGEAYQASLSAGYVWGKMITHAEPQLSDPSLPLHESVNFDPSLLPLTEAAEYMKMLVKVRKSQAKDFLIYGQLLRSLSLNMGSNTYSYYNVNEANPSFDVKLPRVLNSVWKDSQGRIGIMLMNYTNSSQSFTAAFNPGNYGIGNTFTLETLSLTPTAPIQNVTFGNPQTITGNIALPLTMPARSVLFYRIS